MGDPAFIPTPEMIAAAWGAWRVRHPTLRLGPGPGFVEAMTAMLAVMPRAWVEATVEAQSRRMTGEGGADA